jgi:hypothetical protein
MFENRVLSRIFGPKSGEVTREWRKLHNEEYSSPKIFRMIKSRRMKLAGQVAHMRREEAYTGFWWGNIREREHLEVPDFDWRIIL